jgi:hypothetical protein
MAELSVVSQIIGTALNSGTLDDAERGGGGGGRAAGESHPNKRKISARSIISKGASHVTKKPCRVLVFSAFVILLAMFVYTVYLLLTHFTHLFTSDVFWEHVKDIVKVSSSADCSEELPMQRGRQ